MMMRTLGRRLAAAFHQLRTFKSLDALQVPKTDSPSKLAQILDSQKFISFAELQRTYEQNKAVVNDQSLQLLLLQLLRMHLYQLDTSDSFQIGADKLTDELLHYVQPRMVVGKFRAPYCARIVGSQLVTNPILRGSLSHIMQKVM